MTAPTRGIIQAVASGPGPMVRLTVLTDAGEVEGLPCAAGALPPSGVEIVYWRGNHEALGQDAPLLGWATAEAWDERNQYRNRYQREQQRVVARQPDQPGWDELHSDPLGCGECGSQDVTLRDDGDPATEQPGVGLRPWCRVCQGWAD